MIDYLSNNYLRFKIEMTRLVRLQFIDFEAREMRESTLTASRGFIFCSKTHRMELSGLVSTLLEREAYC